MLGVIYYLKTMKELRKHIIVLFLIGINLLYSCSINSTLSKIEQFQKDKQSLKEITDIFNKKPIMFLSELKRDTINLAYHFDSLGFGFFLEQGHYKYKERIYFSIIKVIKNDSTIGFSIKPFYWNIGRSGAYDQIYKQEGWRTEKNGEFKKKYYNYSATTNPINSNLIDYSVGKSNLISFMSPLNGIILYYGPEHRTDEAFDTLIVKLTEQEIYYLLNSPNPITRVRIIKICKEKNIKLSDDINKWIDELIENSPRIKTQYGSLHNYMEIKEVIKYSIIRHNN